MCTVSFFYKGGNDFMLTSNRDEAIGRKTKIPHQDIFQNSRMFYPKDELAGGTWIGVSENERLVCLLNGAFQKHLRKDSYRKSRGLIVKELLAAEDAVLEIENYDFNGIEPFTVVLTDWKHGLKLYELIWNEEKAYFTELPLKPKMWNSSTLYTDEMKAIRQTWFGDYFNKKELSYESVLHFHEHYGMGDKDLDLQIDRGLLKTVSITSFDKRGDDIISVYKDLLNHDEYTESVRFNVGVSG
ncbi:MAG: NRDE family protein [Flavobacteriaceae bacterium]|nr:NRDE family protein [Flavobacteriaceae bacterium]